MSKRNKLLRKARNSPGNLRYDEICQLAEYFGFKFKAQVGSHRQYTRAGLERPMNFQDNKGKAVEYQVKQLVEAIDRFYGADDEEK